MKLAVKAPFKLTAMVARGVASGLVALALAIGVDGLCEHGGRAD